jgi:hypothetical protein
MNFLKFTIVFASYLSTLSLILLGTIWWLSDSSSIFLEVLFLISTPTLRIFVFGVIGITLMFTIIYLKYSKPKPILPHSMPLLRDFIITLLREESSTTFSTDMKQIHEIIATLFFGTVGLFLMGYFFTENIVEWKKTVFALIGTVLPIIIGATLVFLLSGPIAIITFYIGDLIKHYRS